MSNRKRTPDKEPEAQTGTAVAKPAAAANDNAPAQTGTAVAEPPATEASANKPTFAERVGQRKWVAAPDPFGIDGDYLAGVRLLESKRDRQMALRFEEKPSKEVIDKLKDAGYHWNPVDRIWAHPVREDSAHTTRVEATDLYKAVVLMIRQERGIEAGPEIPF